MSGEGQLDDGLLAVLQRMRGGRLMMAREIKADSTQYSRLLRHGLIQRHEAQKYSGAHRWEYWISAKGQALLQAERDDNEIVAPEQPYPHGTINEAFAGPCAGCGCDDLTGSNGDANDCGCACHASMDGEPGSSSVTGGRGT